MDKDKYIRTSQTSRTLFKISIRGSGNEGRVMIGSDDIQIELAYGGLKIKTDDDSNVLTAGKKAELYKFGDFDGGFLVQGSKGPDACSSESDDADKVYKTDNGEIWELID